MKTITQIVTAVCIAVLLFSVGMANAQTVLYEDAADDTKATKITGLSVTFNEDDPDEYTVIYNVTFVMNLSPDEVYGDFDTPVFDIDGLEKASPANIALVAALFGSTALTIGVVDGQLGEKEAFEIGYNAKTASVGPPIELCEWLGGRYNDIGGVYEWRARVNEATNWEFEPRTWALFEEDPTAGIDDEILGAAISVYPNPADNVVHIKTTANITAINISDITGKVIQNLQFKVGASATTLDVSAFTAGVYFLKLEDDKGRVSVKKILIQ